MNFEKKIFNEKLYFRENAISKIGSLENIEHHPKSTDKQIYNEQLPWLRYNKPNLPDSIKEKINRKQFSLENKAIYSTLNRSENEETGRPKARKLYLPRIYDEKNVNSDAARTENEPNDTFSDVTRNINPQTQRAVRIAESIVSEKRSLEETEYTTRESDNKRQDVKLTKSVVVHKAKTLKNDRVNFQPQKCDVATETDKERLVSVEVQTIEEASNAKSMKLQKALRNSNTFENNFSLTSKKSDHWPPGDQKEDIITSRVIETFLPSIRYVDKENKAALSQSYSYINGRRGGGAKTNDLTPISHAVTYAGMDFLDQYWAAQRKMRLNKEFNSQKGNGIDHNDQNEYQWTEAEALFLLGSHSPKLVDKKVEHNFKDLYKERVQYYTELREGSTVIRSPNIDVITSKDLRKIIL